MKKIPIFARLWTENPVLSGALGLCPLLAVSTNFATSLVLSLSTFFVLFLSITLVKLFQKLQKPSIRLPMFMLYIGGTTVFLQLILESIAYPFEKSIGIFLPLIITNCLVLAEAENAHQKKLSYLESTKKTLKLAFGFSWILLLIGGLREFLGTGSLFSGLFYFWQANNSWHLQSSFSGIPLMLLPPGAFFTLAFLLIIKRAIEKIYAKND